MRTLQALTFTSTGLLLALAFVPATAHAIHLPFFLGRSNSATVARLQWHTDYSAACCEAQCERQMLLVNFVPDGNTGAAAAQRSLERFLAQDARLRAKLKNFVLLRLPHDATVGRLRNRRLLLDDPAFVHLGGQPGIAILDCRDADAPHFGRIVTALPLSNGKYYRWRNSHLAVALDLPPGTITQRTMVWAVRTHPESPQSTAGRQHPALADAAEKQSAYQARIGVQGHHHWETRFHQVSAAAGAGAASEVVAESWPDQNLIDSCIDCVLSWRQSPGHWSAVSRRQRLFGYDIRRGKNGIWYGTGIFAN